MYNMYKLYIYMYIHLEDKEILGFNENSKRFQSGLIASLSHHLYNVYNTTHIKYILPNEQITSFFAMLYMYEITYTCKCTCSDCATHVKALGIPQCTCA